MAGLNYHAHAYIRQLNDYQVMLSSCVELTAHLLDQSLDDATDEWRKAGCWLMRDLLKKLASELPFPPEDSMKLDGEVSA